MLVKLFKRYSWIILIDVLVIWFAGLALSYRENLVAVGTVAILSLFNFIFIRKATYPYRYMFPGLLCFFLFMVFPISFTIYIAFTNLGTGHVLSFENAKNLIVSEKFVPEEENVFFLNFGEGPKDYFIHLTEEESNKTFWAVFPKSVVDKQILKLNESLIPLDQLVSEAGIQLYDKKKLYQSQKLLMKLQAELPTGKVVSSSGISQFAQVRSRYIEDSDGNITDIQANELFRPDFERGAYVGKDSLLLPGFTVPVGFSNFTKLFNNPQIAKPFFKVFVWTFGWAFFTVLLTFSMGMTLALILNAKEMKLRTAYRMMLIIPYSIPFFISVMIFRGMYNKDFGIINELIGHPIPWLEDPTLAKISCLIVNLWLGFPYMLLILTGILQSIPADVYEAARIDGANKWTQFTKITLPMVMSAVAPLLVGSFAFNFNNFVGIYLLTGGLPPMQGVSTPAGETDILISYTYRLAFEGGQGQDFGLASAIAVLIFVVIAILTLINFKYSGVLKNKRV